MLSSYILLDFTSQDTHPRMFLLNFITTLLCRICFLSGNLARSENHTICSCIEVYVIWMDIKCSGIIFSKEQQFKKQNQASWNSLVGFTFFLGRSLDYCLITLHILNVIIKYEEGIAMYIISYIPELFNDGVPTTQVTHRRRRFKGDINVSEIPGQKIVLYGKMLSWYVLREIEGNNKAWGTWRITNNPYVNCCLEILPQWSEGRRWKIDGKRQYFDPVTFETERSASILLLRSVRQNNVKRKCKCNIVRGFN
jgi:hypothetical protein